jgi:pyruvate dehydrogenase (quinone)
MTQSQLVSDFVLQRLGDWGIRRIFGFPGDGINGLMGALRRAQPKFDFIQVAHEELAALMACAHAKFTGEIGVCAATAGPGAIHLLNGLYDAKLDHQPVLAIVGQEALGGLGGSEQQEIDIRALYEGVASYVELVTRPEQVRHVIDRALRIAESEHCVTCIILPNDLQREPAASSSPHEHGMMHSSRGFSRPRLMPHPDALRKAADVLNAGERVAMIVGIGAKDAADQVIRAAALLNAGVAKSLLGKPVLPDDLPFVTGSVGWLGTAASNQMMRECDTLFMIGTAMPYTEYLPQEGQARGVQIDRSARDLGLRYPMEVSLVGDSAETLDALLPLLRQKKDRTWRMHIEQSVSDWWNTVDQHAHTGADPMNPQLALWELSQRLPDNAIITGDCGSAAVWIARFVRMRAGMQFSLSGLLATMGSGMPYALAAKLAHPQHAVIAVVGDGAMQMNGINSLLDVSKYWRRWSDPRFVVLVLNNRDLNYVTWEQRVMEGDPKFEASQDIPDFHFADYAKLLGLDGVRVDRPDQIGGAWDAAFRADRPFVIDAMVDANVPTLPPELRPKQREHLARALSEGDPDASQVRRQLAEHGFTGVM